MPELSGKAAVVTGAASGIGRALAQRFAREGMRVALADIEADALERVCEQLRAQGAEVIGVQTDVSDATAVARLADESFAAFGRVDVLCNNAGVLSGGLSWETPAKDWEWVFGVNVLGVAHGIRSFVPRMSAQGGGHVVNVASMAAVTAIPFAAVYHASKHAVLALSECLYKELDATGSAVRVSVLCPELVDTRIADSGRNRPTPLLESPASLEMILKATASETASGLSPDVMADRVVAALGDGRFYILADEGPWRGIMDVRLDDLRAGRNPSLVLP